MADDKQKQGDQKGGQKASEHPNNQDGRQGQQGGSDAPKQPVPDSGAPRMQGASTAQAQPTSEQADDDPATAQRKAIAAQEKEEREIQERLQKKKGGDKNDEA